MASTTNLKLIKNVSEHDAQKIALINAEMDDLDTALGGILTLPVAGLANVTLTRAQALHASLKFTGALTGNIEVRIPVIANLALTPPTTTIGALRNYTIWNATSGAFTLTIKTSVGGSVGVAITQTKTVIISHDGADVRKVTAEV